LGLDGERATRIRTETGTTKDAKSGTTISSPSNAESTEIAGLIAPSPKIQRRAKETNCDDCRVMSPLYAKQRHQREDATLPIVVDAHRDGHIFDRCDDDQGPDHERQHSEYRRGIGGATGEAQRRLERVEGARSDVAEDHPNAERPSAVRFAAFAGRATIGPHQLHQSLSSGQEPGRFRVQCVADGASQGR